MIDRRGVAQRDVIEQEREREKQDEQTEAALDPLLLKHRDMMYARHLELPLAL